MTTIVYEDHRNATLEAFARGIFYFGALASFLDGLLTWLVVRSAGTQIEENWGMGWLMCHVGLVPAMVFRVAIGIFLFWYVSNMLIGRRIFFRPRRAVKYSEWLSKSHGTIVSWFLRIRPTLTAIEAMFILVITSAVVGNNINAAMVWFHAH